MVRACTYLDRDRRGSAAPSLRPDLLRDTRFADIALRPSKSTEQSTLLALYARAWAVHLSLPPSFFRHFAPSVSFFFFFLFCSLFPSPIATVRPLISRILFYSSGYLVHSCIRTIPFVVPLPSNPCLVSFVRTMSVSHPLSHFLHHPLRSSHLPILFTRFRIPTPAAVSRDFECIGLDTPHRFIRISRGDARFFSLLSKFTTGNLDKDFFPSSRTIESKENYFIRGENREGNNNSRKMPKRRAKEEIINREIFLSPWKNDGE